MMIKEKERNYFGKPIQVFLIIVIFIGFAVFMVFFFEKESPLEVVEVIENENGDEIKIASDGTKFIVDPSKIGSGGPPKGGIGVDKGIPALASENINFVTVAEADDWIEDEELVLVLNYKEVTRIYPLQIMTWHEIANDEIGGDKILVTYCPLCGSGIAYESYIEVDGEKVESRFGTSGKLYNSNLVMYDEETDTYWSQIDGKAIVGELTGQELTAISIDTVVWKDFVSDNSNAEVLSRETGMDRPYGQSAYASYFANDFLLFDVENEDTEKKIKNKDVVFGVELNGKYKAYTEASLIERGEIVDEGFGVRVTRTSEGIVVVTSLDTNEEIVKERDFWFAWFAFHPETELYGF